MAFVRQSGVMAALHIIVVAIRRPPTEQAVGRSNAKPASSADVGKAGVVSDAEGSGCVTGGYMRRARGWWGRR